MGEDLDEVGLQLAAERTLQEAAAMSRGKVEAVFGSPGSDYLAGAYLTALHDQDDIGRENFPPSRSQEFCYNIWLSRSPKLCTSRGLPSLVH